MMSEQTHPPAKDMGIAVVVPAYRVTRQITDLLRRIGPEVSRIYVVDDCCPENSGSVVERECTDPRVRVVRREANGGVGAATMSGYQHAIADGAAVIVKLDGDGQMDPRLLPRFVRPILDGQADYTKGNRFFNPEDSRNMPWVRKVGNAALSFWTKLSSGYWDVLDPTNGYTAIDARVAAVLPLGKISTRYFFESDMLFRLNTLRAVVVDIPMPAIYANETSNLHITRILHEFIYKHLRNTAKRIVYNYFVRGFSAASLEIVFGSLLVSWGLGFGIVAWLDAATRGVPATAGTVMLAAMPLLMGAQLLLSFLGHDIAATPSRPIGPRL